MVESRILYTQNAKKLIYAYKIVVHNNAYIKMYCQTMYLA